MELSYIEPAWFLQVGINTDDSEEPEPVLLSALSYAI
jgi:hypothetical protein